MWLSGLTVGPSLTQVGIREEGSYQPGWREPPHLLEYLSLDHLTLEAEKRLGRSRWERLSLSQYLSSPPTDLKMCLYRLRVTIVYPCCFFLVAKTRNCIIASGKEQEGETGHLRNAICLCLTSKLFTPWLCVSTVSWCAVTLFNSKILGVPQRVLIKSTDCSYGLLTRNPGANVQCHLGVHAHNTKCELRMTFSQKHVCQY